MEFDNLYMQSMVDNLKMLHPDKDENIIIDFVKKKMEPYTEKEDFKNFKEKEARIKIFRYDSEENQTEVESLKEIINVLINTNGVISGNGAIYHKQDDGVPNPSSHMVDILLKTRKKYKNLKFQYINDKVKKEFYDTLQKIYKILVNSYYGASIERNSIFFDKFMGSSITLTGRIIITTAIASFESFFNNFYFKNENDFILYSRRIINEDYKYNIDDYININISEKELFDYIIEKFEDNKVDEKIIKKIISTFSQTERNKIYYKNNFYALLDNDFFHNKLDKVVGIKDFFDPNEPSDFIDESLSEIWDYIEDFVVFKYMYFYRWDFATNHKKKTILVVDTDSNFLYLKPFSNYCKKNYKEKYKDYDDSLRISTVNICTYFLTKYINVMFFMMGEALNIQSDKRELINMKNEFLISKLMLTKNKKSYAGLILMNEGKMLANPELQLKGLSLRKTSLNKNIRDYFTEVLDKKILRSENIDISSIYKDYFDIDKTIRESLLKGSTEYSVPGRVNDMDSYALPFTIQSLRGSLLWNALYPDNPINIPEKINLLKLKDIDMEKVKSLIPEETYEKIENLFNKYPELEQYGVRIIGIPKKVKIVPKEIIPLIDIDTIINDNIKPTLILLESIGFKPLEITDNQYPTNIVEI